MAKKQAVAKKAAGVARKTARRARESVRQNTPTITTFLGLGLLAFAGWLIWRQQQASDTPGGFFPSDAERARDAERVRDNVPTSQKQRSGSGPYDVAYKDSEGRVREQSIDSTEEGVSFINEVLSSGGTLSRQSKTLASPGDEVELNNGRRIRLADTADEKQGIGLVRDADSGGFKEQLITVRPTSGWADSIRERAAQEREDRRAQDVIRDAVASPLLQFQ